MKVRQTSLEGVFILEPEVHIDSRGFFLESYNSRTLASLGFDYRFVQDNHSLSTGVGTIRGLHIQEEPQAQTKLVHVITGAVFDVAVDLRQGSATYGKWLGVILSGQNQRQLLIPRGFAHGFCTLIENTHVCYKVDNYYSPEHEKTIPWNHPQFGIDWPVRNPILSDKDRLFETDICIPRC